PTPFYILSLHDALPIFSGNQVIIDWGWQGQGAFLDMIELQVDRSGGQGYGFLANDTTPGYVDTMPFPATPTKWTYRGIYRVGDQDPKSTRLNSSHVAIS